MIIKVNYQVIKTVPATKLKGYDQRDRVQFVENVLQQKVEYIYSESGIEQRITLIKGVS